MKNTFWVLVLCVATSSRSVAQTDSAETMRWVEKQAERIDTLLRDATRSHDQVNIIFRLMDAYLLFDAVALAGVYCPDVREAAQKGRNLSDVLNFRLEKDMNSNLLRATEARLQAEKMRFFAQNCSENKPEKPLPAFRPADVIREDASIVALDLTDGMAAEDFHILSQKLEHAIRVLHDVRHLAATFSQCGVVSTIVDEAIGYCESALAARNWTEVKRAVDKALACTERIASAECR